MKLRETSDGVKRQDPHQRTGIWAWLNFWVKIETGGSSKHQLEDQDSFMQVDVRIRRSVRVKILGGVEQFPNETCDDQEE